MKTFIPHLALLLCAGLTASCADDAETGTTATTATAATSTATSTVTTGGGGTGGDGTGGTGGTPEGNCGFGDACDPVDNPGEYCAANDCGDAENVAFGFCGEDGDFVCSCIAGVCSREECFETSTCTQDPAGDAACMTEAGSLCGSPEQVREAFCFQFFDGFRCEIVCQTGGPVSCEN